MRSIVRFLVLTLLVSTAACSTREARETGNVEQMQSVAGEAYVLELVNPMTHTVSVSYSQSGATQALGSIEAGKTVRFTIPNRGDSDFLLLVSMADGSQAFDKRVDLRKGTTNRVELKP